MEIYKGAQTTYQIAYHLVWGVKYGYHLLNNNMKEFLVSQIKQICESYEFHFMCIGIAPNHVHLFVGAPPKIAPAKIAQIVKSISGRMMFKHYPQIKKKLWGGEIWKDGYYVGTIGETQTEAKIRDYINKQEGKHMETNMKQLKLFF
ncbi:MAG: IS200/IS605 family transposase [Candidatus Buchananbacteria bacterium]|nr:IS200/IS605 family transposase [Candidatus Buchananbacteria bacterium]